MNATFPGGFPRPRILPTFEEFFESVEYIPPDGAKLLYVELIGGGGGGAHYNGIRAAGGGGGGFSFGAFPIKDLPPRIQISVGQGGTPGNNSDGGNGGDTVFGDGLLRALGGKGGGQNNAGASGDYNAPLFITNLLYNSYWSSAAGGNSTPSSFPGGNCIKGGAGGAGTEGSGPGFGGSSLEGGDGGDSSISGNGQDGADGGGGGGGSTAAASQGGRGGRGRARIWAM